MTMGVSTTTAIAYHRYSLLAKRRPNGPATNMSPLAVTWLASIITAAPMLYVQTIIPVKDNLLGVVLFEQCVEIWGVTWGRPALTMFMLFFHHVFPCLVIAYYHFKIVRFINKDRKFQKSPLMKKQENQRNRKTTILLVAVTAIFLLSWLPFHIFHLIKDYWGIFIEERKLYVAFAGVHIAAMSSTLWNALLYGILNDNLKMGIADCFTRASVRRRRRSLDIVNALLDEQTVTAQTTMTNLNPSGRRVSDKHVSDKRVSFLQADTKV